MADRPEYDWADDARQSYSLAIATLKDDLRRFPRVDIGRATLYQADIKDIYKLLPKAHCIVTDPPYRLTSGGSGESPQHNKMRGGWMAGYSNNGCPIECDITWPEILEICYDLSATNADVYLMANDKNLLPCLEASRNAGFGIHNILVWDKISATANRWYMKNCEYIAYLWKGKARTINDCGSKQLVRLRQIDETSHPTEKPVALMEHYVLNSTNPNGTVIDPFMGSGTTGVASVKNNRNFIGVEKTKEYFDIAVKRIEEATTKASPSVDTLRDRLL